MRFTAVFQCFFTWLLIVFFQVIEPYRFCHSSLGWLGQYRRLAVRVSLWFWSVSLRFSSVFRLRPAQWLWKKNDRMFEGWRRFGYQWPAAKDYNWPANFVLTRFAAVFQCFSHGAKPKHFKNATKWLPLLFRGYVCFSLNLYFYLDLSLAHSRRIGPRGSRVAGEYNAPPYGT